MTQASPTIEDLDDLVSSFLAQGGAVMEVPTVLAETRPLRPPHKAVQPAPVKKFRPLPTDAADVATILPLMVKGVRARDLCEALEGCAVQKVQRLLRAYLHDHPVTPALLQVTYKERAVKRLAKTDEKLLPLVREALAQGLIGYDPIARHLGCAPKTVRRVARDYAIHIPNAKGKLGGYGRTKARPTPECRAMYATSEHVDYLTARGFTPYADGSGWVRQSLGDHQHITAVWDGKRMGSLDCPVGDKVFWAAGSIQAATDEFWQAVVTFADRCPDPITAFVTAEVRAWQRQT